MIYLQLQFFVSGIIPLSPAFHPAGHTSPCSSTNWNAFTNLMYQSGFLPTGKSFIEECLTIPFRSIIQVALKATPLSSPSSHKHPKSLEIFFVISEINGISISPNPPSFLGFNEYSICENFESTEQANTQQPIFLNSAALLLNAIISVGQTKVKSRGQKNNNTYFPLQSDRLIFLKSYWNQASAVKDGANFLTKDISDYFLYRNQLQIQINILLKQQIIRMQSKISELQKQLIQIYRHLHQIPEIGLQEYKTTSFIRQYLNKIKQVEIINPSVQTQLKTGVVAVIRAPTNNSQISKGYLFRCDIDALNFPEQSGVEYCSQNGLHHACGHDAHTSIMLVSVKMIATRKQELKRDAYFVFQPGEEGHGGAFKLLQNYPDLLDSVDHCFALHVKNNTEQKQSLFIPSEYVSANSTRFTIQILGKSAHCLMPHGAIDANYIGCQVVNQIYSVKTRIIDPTHGMTVSVTRIQGGNSNTSISQYMKITGSLRSQAPSDHKRILQHIQKYAKCICELNGAKYTFTISNNWYRAVKNEPAAIKIVENAAKTVFKKIQYVKATYAGQDFCQFSQKKPSCYVLLGVGLPNSLDQISQSIYPIHSNKFKLDQASLWKGAQLWLNIALG